MRLWLPLSLVTTLLCSLPSAQVLTYEAELSGAQARPPNASAGTGSCTVTLDLSTNQLVLTGTFSGMTGNPTVAHIHGVARRGGRGGILVPLVINQPEGVTTHTLDASVVANATTRNAILDGLAYINVHSSVFGPGELAGQIDSVPGSGDPGAPLTVVTGSAGPGDTLNFDCPPSALPGLILLGAALPAGTVLAMPPSLSCGTPSGLGVNLLAPIVLLPGSTSVRIPNNAPSTEVAVQCVRVNLASNCFDLAIARRIAIRP